MFYVASSFLQGELKDLLSPNCFLSRCLFNRTHWGTLLWITNTPSALLESSPLMTSRREDKNVHENKLKVRRFQVVRACNANYLRIDKRLQSVLMELTGNAEFPLTHKMIYWGVVAWCFENIFFPTLGFKFLKFPQPNDLRIFAFESKRHFSRHL